MFVDTVIYKSEKTVLGYLIVKLCIRSDDGVIQPVLHGGYIPRSLFMKEIVSCTIMKCQVLARTKCSAYSIDNMHG